MIVGVQKAGTSSVKRYLAEHPSICTHKQGELAFFVDDNQYKQGYEKAYSRYFANCTNDESILLAKNVGVMYLPEAVKRLHHHNPDMQLVVLLRNPVDRAYSAYWYLRRRGWEDAKTFEEAIAQEPSRLQAGGLKGHHCSYLNRGLYYKQLEVLLEHFKKEQVHVFLFEELKSDATSVCSKIVQLFNLDTDFSPEISRRYNTVATARSQMLAQLIAYNNPIKQVVKNLLPYEITLQIKNKLKSLNEKQFSPPKMNQSTRNELIDFFKSHNIQLSDLLGVDLSQWNQN
ncbi:MAG: sulfotransferase domain-containing protein [Microcoleus sp. SIO2G3]|nr:sulfotransferase domain-containing protein [Microcoleus sp. SIO2G3]